MLGSCFSISALLRDIVSGKIQLPDFQRGWVWKDEENRGAEELVEEALRTP